MARYQTTVSSSLSPEDAFSYMASFQNVAEWDPGVVEADRIDGGDIAVGSRFRVVIAFVGRKLPLEYAVTEYDRPNRVKLVAESKTLRSIDEITVRPAGSGSSVSYTAEVDFLGPLRIFTPILNLTFQKVGDRAAAGLRKRLA